MKRTKLFSSICLLVLTLACLTFGVYSAVKTDFTASGTITFNAYNLDVDCIVTFSGTQTPIATQYLTSNANRDEHAWTDTSVTPTDITKGLTNLKLAFDELSENQNLININFEFVNYSAYMVEAIGTVTLSGSAAENILYQPTYQSIMDKKSATGKNSCGFEVMFAPKGNQVLDSSDNFSIQIDLAPAAEDIVTYVTAGDENPAFWSDEESQFDSADGFWYNNFPYGYNNDKTKVSLTMDETVNNAEYPEKTYSFATRILGYPVASIVGMDYSCCNVCNIEYLMFPSSAKYAGWFYTSEDTLKTIIFSEGVEAIGNFSEATAMTSITLPHSLTRIGYTAFKNCYSLTSIIIPENVTSIGDYAFENCTSLASITMSNSVTSIGYSAFSSCSSLTAITIPSSVTSIGGNAFGSCSGLTSIIVESGNTVYDSRDNCNAIIETATNTLISGCQKTVIPASVTSIGTDAFRGHDSLGEVILPTSVTSIGNYAFIGCSRLMTITIPKSVTSMGNYAFSGCTNLTKASFETATGWSVCKTKNGTYTTPSDLTPTTEMTEANAKLLKTTYYSYFWKRG